MTLHFLSRRLRVRLRACRLYRISRARLATESLTEWKRLHPSMPDEDTEQLAYLGAVMRLEKRKERVLKVKMRRMLRELGVVEVDPEAEWLLIKDEEKEKVLERMIR